MRRLIWAICAFVSVGVTAAVTQEAKVPWRLALSEDAWRNLKVPGQDENQFSFQDNTIQVISDSSVSFRYLKIPKSRPAPPVVQWSWQVKRYSALSYQDEQGHDDRPLAVHLWFDDATDGSLFGAIGRIFGYPKVGHLITYVWGAQEQAGTILPNPHYAKGSIIVLVGQGGKAGHWSDVRRDIVQDYMRAFDEVPDLATLRYVAISADSDDMSGYSQAVVRSLSFQQP